jgi:hypothetical protein
VRSTNSDRQSSADEAIYETDTAPPIRVGSVWFHLETYNLDTAIEVAARVPAARYGGAVEIPPSEVYW